MSDIIEDYRNVAQTAPGRYNRWHLRGAGLESLSEETVDLPAIGPEEILVRHDACGICFSDIKIINLGPEHPRLIGRDMINDPVVMGHEVALTIVEVGEALKDRFQVGQRFIVQADVYFKGANLAYGYVLDGGMSQFGVVGEEVLRGDEGCYLLPLDEKTGYVEAALIEPWACVVAAYEFPNYRKGVKADGRTLVYYAAPGLGKLTAEQVGWPAGFVEAVTLEEAEDAYSGRKGFDDILVIGTPDADAIVRLSALLGKHGTMAIGLTGPLTGPVTLDIGRIHYDQLLYCGRSIEKPADIVGAYTSNQRSDLLAGGTVWFIGAGGPMGQMHIQRAIMSDNRPAKIVVTDVSDERMSRVSDRFGAKAAENGIELALINPVALGEEGYDRALKAAGPYSDIVCLVPVPDVVKSTAPYLGQDGVYNIFAGVAKGVTTQLDLGTILAKNQRFVGTSGSSIEDLRHTLELVETRKLSTNASLAAIGGMKAFRDGLGAVKAGAFPGKTVIFPQIEDLPLMSLDELRDALPGVYAKLEDGKFWTKAAEEELLREKLATRH